MFIWILAMNNKYITKKTFLLINILLFFLEIIMIYLIIKSILSKDLISPNEVSFYEYLKIKLSDLI